ncbi:transposable element-derived 1-like [Octopus vulgaris]|uniref:Transposable element-derived 1-like n=1 Tax=Octopus vulgaris TaxID=6645 RepID=A0AA36AXF0_OCTVU|nr:transposable element-derived 1-like [Octopus vulgaris]
MPPKRPTPKASGSEPKCLKKVVTLHEKVQLLDMLQEGKSYDAVGCCYGINKCTMHYIKKNEIAIRTTVAVSFCESAKMIMTVRNKHLVRMEFALALWISDCKRKNIPLSGNIIHKKEQKLYQQFDGGDRAEGIKELQSKPLTAPEPKDFQASKGWFHCFQKRFKIKYVSLHGETTSGNKEAAMKYLDTFRQILKDKRYKLEQVFNMDETGLFWKKMPSRRFLLLNNETHRCLSTVSLVPEDSQDKRTLSRKERIEILRSFYHQIIGSFFASTVDQSNTDPSKLSHSATETYITTDTHKCYAIQSLPYQFFVLYNNDIPTYAMRNVTQKTLSILTKDKSIQI